MSAISLDKLIKINSSAVSAATRAVTLANMVMSKNPLIPINDTQRALPFTTSDQVASIFGINSKEYDYATYYFKGYTGQTGMAKLLWLGRWVDTDVGAYIRGNRIIPSSALTAFKNITAGDITFNFNDTSQTLEGLDFSLVTSLSDCAAIIEAALTVQLAGITVTYSPLTQSFTAQGASSLVASSVGYCDTGTVASLLKMSQQNLPVLSQGSAAQTPAENWQAVKTVTKNWAGGSKLWAIDAAPYTEALADAEWFNAQLGAFVYAPYTDVLADVLGFAQVVAQADYENSFINYSKYDLVAGELGALAAVNYRLQASVISLTNKSFAGITPLVNDDATYDLLTTAKINFYGRFQSRNDEFNFAEEGWLTGQWLYIENCYNNIWIVDQLQIKIAAYFAAAKIIGYNAVGYTSLQAQLNPVGVAATNNGVASIGNVFNEAIIQKLQAEAGFDLAATLTSQGYYAQIYPADYDQRVNHEPVNGVFYYTNSGNIGKVIINNNLVV